MIKEPSTKEIIESRFDRLIEKIDIKFNVFITLMLITIMLQLVPAIDILIKHYGVNNIVGFFMYGLVTIFLLHSLHMIVKSHLKINELEDLQKQRIRSGT